MEDAFRRFQELWNDVPSPHDEGAAATKLANREVARAYARTVREEFPLYFLRYQGATMEEMVPIVSGYRSSGNEIARIGADIYIVTEYAIPHIGGVGHKEIS